MWPELLRLRKKDVVCLTVCVAAYFIISILLYKDVSKDFYFSIGLVAVVLAVLAFRSISARGNPVIYSRRTESFLFVIVALGIGGMAFSRFSPWTDNYISEFKKAKGFQQETDATEAAAIKNADSSGTFFRYSDSGSVIVSNGSVVSGVSNTHTYWSLVNSGVTDFYQKTLTSVKQIFNMKGFDTRTMLEEICSTKYFVTKSADDKKIPYGYHLVSNTEVAKPNGSSVNYFVYENEYALPFGYTYDSSITEEQAEILTPLELQEAMIQTVILDGSDPESGVADEKKQENSFSGLSFHHTKKDYEVTCDSDGVTMQGNSFVVTGTDQKVKLTFSGAADSETYLAFQNLQFSGVSEYDLYNDDETIDPLELYGKEEWEALGEEKQKELKRGARRYVEPSMMNLVATAKHEDGSKTVNKIIYQTPRYKWYNNRKDLLFNLCYAESPVTSIEIKFPKRGVYTFGGMDIYCQPFTDYADQTEQLRENTLENFDLHENEANVTEHITGTINLQKPKILFLSIPYSDGWTAFVDGKETDILKANYAFMALDLDAGEHEIELRYRTPGLKTGIAVSCAGVVAVVLIVWFRKRKGF
ncbi:MAG: YfhO family protein [Eubacterium sp.]|nr:YfhO family protein [Eubacterium sp.]